MIDVCVGEKDATDRCAKGAGGGEDIISRVREVGVDEGEAIGLANEVAVDEAETRELVAVGGDRGQFHGELDATCDSWIGWIGDAFDSRISCLRISDRSCALKFKVKGPRAYL